jgi:hypothetical protein
MRTNVRNSDHGTPVRGYRNTMLAIPDTVQGAVTISIIDFVLSFFIISGIGVILAVLPAVNRRWKLDEASLKRGH